VSPGDQADHNAKSNEARNSCVRELESAALEFIDVHNAQRKPLVWTKSADAILNSTGRFASRTLAADATNNI
jgi:hypothetical protein